MRRAAAVVLAFGLALAIHPAEAATAYVYDTEGKANLTRDRKTSELPPETICKAGDLYRTSDDGSVDLNLFSWVGVRLLKDGDLAVRSVAENDLKVELLRGEALVYVRKRVGGSRFIIETPSISVAVENTELRPEAYVSIYLSALEKDGLKASKCVVKKGEAFVTFRDSGNSIRLRNNESVEYIEGQFAPSSRGATQEELKLADQSRGIYVE